MMRNTILWLFVIVISSCANIGRPSGGPVDKEAPIVVKALPDNESLNFNGKKIELQFDENIQLQNLQQELIVSPTLQKTPEIVALRNKIFIELKEPLQPNTTYVFNFGNAIVDFHESNKLAGLKYVISTGDKLDTLQQHFTINDALEKKPKSACIVALYNKFDFENTTQKPNYYSRTDAVGKATIFNIKSGKYDVIAFSDENGNLFPDLKTEAASLLQREVSIEHEQNKDIELNVFLNEKSSVFKSAEFITKGAVLLKKINFNNNVRNLRVEIDKPTHEIQALSKTESIFWLKNKNESNVKVYAYLADKIIDSIIVANAEGKARSSVLTSDKVNVSKYFQDFELNTNGKCISLMFPTAIKTLERSKFQLMDEFKKFLKFDISKDEDDLRKVNIFIDDISSKQIQINIGKEALQNLWDEKNDSISYLFNVQQPEKLSALIFDIKNADVATHYIFTLKNKAQEVIKTIYKNGIQNEKISFPHLLPDEYDLLIVEDKNADGFWTSGNVIEGKNPEKVFWIRGVKTRANWDTEREFIFN